MSLARSLANNACKQIKTFWLRMRFSTVLCPSHGSREKHSGLCRRLCPSLILHTPPLLHLVTTHLLSRTLIIKALMTVKTSGSQRLIATQTTGVCSGRTKRSLWSRTKWTFQMSQRSESSEKSSRSSKSLAIAKSFDQPSLMMATFLRLRLSGLSKSTPKSTKPLPLRESRSTFRQTNHGSAWTEKALLVKSKSRAFIKSSARSRATQKSTRSQPCNRPLTRRTWGRKRPRPKSPNRRKECHEMSQPNSPQILNCPSSQDRIKLRKRALCRMSHCNKKFNKTKWLLITFRQMRSTRPNRTCLVSTARRRRRSQFWRVRNRKRWVLRMLRQRISLSQTVSSSASNRVSTWQVTARATSTRTRGSSRPSHQFSLLMKTLKRRSFSKTFSSSLHHRAKPILSGTSEAWSASSKRKMKSESKRV